MAGKLRITVTDGQGLVSEFTPEEMAEIAPLKLQAAERVPGLEGEAFDVPAWHEAWRRSILSPAAGAVPTHLHVEAADEFQATIPWSEAGQAFLLYRQGGEPLRKGAPLRLYVPDGSSQCLNVKSIVKIDFLTDGSLGQEAAYGFRNRISPEQLLRKPKE